MSNLTEEEKSKIIKQLSQIAKKRGGLFLAKEYIGARIPHEWQCKEKHDWKATPDNVKRGQWCPICVGKMSPELAYQYFKKLAKERRGKLLSDKYIKSAKKLKWQCREGHVWKATANSVKMGTWCRICATQISRKKRMSSIVIFQKIAQERSGKLSSNRFDGVEHKLKWQCDKGHVWEATPAHVKNGTWCPVCRGSKKLGLRFFKK